MQLQKFMDGYGLLWLASGLTILVAGFLCAMLCMVK